MMSEIKYDVVCPFCKNRAVAFMKPLGNNGTYREPRCKMVAEKISCTICGKNQESSEGLPFLLWFRTEIRGNILWLNNEVHGNALLEWIEGPRERKNSPESSWIEILPSWMLSSKNRELVSRKIRELLEQ